MNSEEATFAPSVPLGAAVPVANPREEHHLKGRIGTLELIVTVLAFSAPVTVVAAFAPFVIVYDGAGAPVAFVISVVLLLLFAVGYTAMSRYLPNAGAFYAYITAGLGKRFGLGSSLLAMMGYILMAVGTVCFFGVAASAMVVDVFSGPEITWWVYSLGCLLATGALGYFRIDLSAKVLMFAMAGEILIVLLFDAAVARDGGPQGLSLKPFTWGEFSAGSVGLAVLFAATCFLGFEATAIFREETKDPDKTVPRATYLAVILIGIFYIAGAYFLIISVGPSHAQAAATKNYAGMFPDGMEQLVGVWARDIFRVLIVTSAFACLLSVQNILSRYAFSLGVDEVLPRRLGRVNPKHGSPSVASVTISVVLIGTLLAFTASDPGLTYSRLAGTGGFCILVLMFLTGISVVRFFSKHPDPQVSVWHRMIAPVLSFVSMGVVIYLAIANFSTMTAGSVGQAVIYQVVVWGTFLVGVVLATYYKSARPEVFTRIGRQQV